MRFGQKQRLHNKSARQEFEQCKLNKAKLREFCFSDNIALMKQSHMELTGRNMHSHHITFDSSLDWDTFLDNHDIRFENMMKRRCLKQSKISKQEKHWYCIINTFLHVLSASSQQGADKLYQVVIGLLARS